MGVLVITSPEPLADLELAKLHLRLDGEDEDALINALIAAVSAHVDGPKGWLEACIGQQTLEWRAESLPACGRLNLPYGPAQTISSVEYLDVNGVLQTLDPAVYQLADDVLRIRAGQSFPVVAADANAVRVRWVAGYPEIPPAIVPAVLMMLGDLYAQRETFVVGTIAAKVPMSVGAEMLLSPFRRWAV